MRTRREIIKSVSYTEINEKTSFDWNEFLSTPQRSESWHKAKRLAGSWVTCAVGSQCFVIPRDTSNGGAPFDKELRTHGLRFYMAVSKKDKPKARELLKLIEKRSGKLIRGIIG